MGPWGITIDKFNRVIVSETFPGRVQVFRYVTDAEVQTEEKERASADQKRTGISAPQAASAAAKDMAPK
jgi:hypothetical protein